MSWLLPAAVVGLGLALTMAAVLGVRVRRPAPTLAEMLALEEVAPPDHDDDPFALPGSRIPFAGAVAQAGALLQRFDGHGRVDRALRRARIGLKAGEYLFVVGLAMVLGGGFIGIFSGTPVVGVLVAVCVAVIGAVYPGMRAKKRSDAIRVQLPEAFGLIASSVKAGHTFLRSVQILGGQIAEPLASELEQVTSEVALGSDLITALEHMTERVDVVELEWSVRAVRIQQTTGGSLAEILRTLADFMLVREEVNREVKALTAEGKFSGYVLMAMPPFMGVAMSAINPGYLNPLFKGKGILLLVVAVVMLAIGGAIIRRMVKVEV